MKITLTDRQVEAMRMTLNLHSHAEYPYENRNTPLSAEDAQQYKECKDWAKACREVLKKLGV